VVFYDNAQNVYGRATPSWSELGLDMRGRSTVMKESFRSTRPVLEYAINVLATLHPLRRDADLRELVRQGLLEEVQRAGEPWWSVRYCQSRGPAPELRRFRTREDEAAALASRLRTWIDREGVRPADIRVLCNGRPQRERAVAVLEEALSPLDARVEEQTGRSFTRREDTVVVSTAHSFKGHEAEVIAVPFADRFEAGDGAVLAHALYVALTRARSVLYVSSLARLGSSGPGTSIDLALERASRLLAERPDVADATTALEDERDMVRRLGAQHARWYARLRGEETLEEGPIVDPDGAIVAEPLFWFEGFACFGSRDPGKEARWRLQDLGYQVLTPGQDWRR
jgi:superfamily I DNA/RNA helicase